MADAIGIDVGSYKTVLACVKQRGIEIVLSETSSKWTPTVAAYTDQERLIGDSAINQMKKNFKNSLQFFARFLGLNQDCAVQIEEENKFVTYKVVNMEGKKVGFEVTLRGEKHTFTPEQIMAYYLKKVKTYFEKAGMPSKEIVISVPSYATNSERQAYLDSAEIAGIQCVRLINESTACALTYGFFRKNDLDAEKPRTVAFVDFGHSKLSVTFASFTKGKMKVLGTHSNKNLGARQIDLQLFDLLGGEFAKKYGCDPRNNVRCRLRLLDSIEKVRKLLTANKEADVHCESLMEDEDLHRNIKRDDLEELVAPFIQSFRECL
jgi:molecular chaperone DnaK (HSP70)